MENMTEEEFDLLDELYFVKKFDELTETLRWEKDALKEALWNVIQKEWVKCFLDLTEIEEPSFQIYLTEYLNYQYIATKKGLLAHNRN
jgi:hypothetical protein